MMQRQHQRLSFKRMTLTRLLSKKRPLLSDLLNLKLSAVSSSRLGQSDTGYIYRVGPTDFKKIKANLNGYLVHYTKNVVGG